MGVLIVEDDDLVFRALARLLLANHWEVARATTVEQACEQVDEDFELVLLDLRLGEQSGMAVLEKLARRRPPVATVVVSGTGLHDEASKISALFGVLHVAESTAHLHLRAAISDELRVVGRVCCCGLVGLDAICARTLVRNLIRALGATNGNQGAAAAMLGMPRTTLQDAVTRFGITPSDWEDPD